jgi:hypothetical protein
VNLRKSARALMPAELVTLANLRSVLHCPLEERQGKLL